MFYMVLKKLIFFHFFLFSHDSYDSYNSTIMISYYSHLKHVFENGTLTRFKFQKDTDFIQNFNVDALKNQSITELNFTQYLSHDIDIDIDIENITTKILQTDSHPQQYFSSILFTIYIFWIHNLNINQLYCILQYHLSHKNILVYKPSFHKWVLPNLPLCFKFMCSPNVSSPNVLNN